MTVAPSAPAASSDVVTVRPGRECRRCGESDRAKMYVDPKAVDGHRTICTTCAPIESRARRERTIAASTAQSEFARPGRVCRSCGEARVAELYADPAAVDGHRTICVPCESTQVRLRNERLRRERKARALEAVRAVAESMHPNGLKRCSGACGLDRALDDFARAKKTLDGLQYRCRDCTNRVANQGKRVRRGPDYGPAYVYRLLSVEGAILYVGYTVNLYGRLFNWVACHSEDKPWWPEVTAVSIVKFATIREARSAEGLAIESESPRYNKYAGSAAYHGDSCPLAAAIVSPDAITPNFDL